MPELPEVESTRRSLERLLKGKRIESVTPDEEDRIVFDRNPPRAVKAALEGARVTGTGRKGKYFWLKLDRRPWPVFHLGMTGNVDLRRPGGEFERAWGGHLWSEGKRERELGYLPFCRFRMAMEDGTEMAITDPRRFGRIRLAEDPLLEPPVSRLGFDPLDKVPSTRELQAILKRRHAPLKAVLLDQGVFAGVGNWIADEVLFQSRLSPHRRASSLDLKEVSVLRGRLLHIVRLAVAKRADFDQYPKAWLFHHRWGKKEDALTHGKKRIIHDTIGGRTTAWVPSVQK